MSTPDTTTLLAQLRAVLSLTNTEIQVAETQNSLISPRINDSSPPEELMPASCPQRSP